MVIGYSSPFYRKNREQRDANPVGTSTWLLIHFCRSFITIQRRQALAAAPLRMFLDNESGASDQEEADHIRILVFSSADCRQCHQLQAPALQRVMEARGNMVMIVEVDATTEHELVQTYHVLTVPSTVILDATGQAQAINYGFANTQRLLTQIDEVLAQREPTIKAITVPVIQE